MIWICRGAAAPCVALALHLTVFTTSGAQSPPAPAPAPKLVVILVVDQMRHDYLERQASSLTGGLKRLMEQGAWFQRAAYPYLNTITCAGHSTISTGSFPYRHGMILNGWFDRKARRSRLCSEDAAVREISYTGTPGTGDGPRALLMPTLADRIRETRRGRVVTISLKARSAIGLAGRGADAIVWFDERGGWSTSSAYSREPVPFVKQFLDANPVTADYDRTWDRTLDAGAYLHADDAAGERPPSGWTRTFPHPLAAAGGKPDAAFYARWSRSPFADEYLGRMAAAAVDAFDLGKGRGIDFLGVSFSSLDLIGHAFGPDSHEVQDTVVRVDLTIGRLLDHLDARVGAANYVLALTADHGVAGIPEQVPGGGRHTSVDVRDAIDGALVPLLGPPPPAPARPGADAAAAPPRATYMAYSAYTDVYLSEAAWRGIRKQPPAMDAVLQAIGTLPGIAEVFRATEVATPEARRSSDPVVRAAALSYRPGRSGDIILVPKENWILSTSATTHGTLHHYDQRVPIIFLGAGVTTGRHSSPATPADIAPTLARLATVPFAHTDGRVLSAALAAPTWGR